MRAEVEERHWARTEQIFAEEADLADLLSARAAAEAAAPAAYNTYEYALASATSAAITASAASAISADEMESELEQAKAQLVAARRQSELARVSLGARLQHTSLTPPLTFPSYLHHTSLTHPSHLPHHLPHTSLTPPSHLPHTSRIPLSGVGVGYMTELRLGYMTEG